MDTLKTCFKCNLEKLITEFYRHPQMGDGLLGKCKECAKSDVRQNRSLRRDYYIAFDKRRANLPHRISARQNYIQTPAGKAAHAKALKKQRELYPQKAIARNETNNAIRDGRLVSMPCEVCGITGTRKSDGKNIVEAHHDDYFKPLMVRWLCKKHHTEHHKQERAKYYGC